jgi:Uncharacterized conserved protein
LTTTETGLSTDGTDGYEAVIDDAAALFSKSQKYGIQMANFLSALPLCTCWEMDVQTLDETTGATGPRRTLALDHTGGLSLHYSAQNDFDSNVELVLAKKWVRANAGWDLGARVMLPDFAIEHLTAGVQSLKSSGSGRQSTSQGS